MDSERSQLKVLHLISSLEMGGAEKLLLDLIEENSKFDRVNMTVVVMNDLVDEQMGQTLRSMGVPVYFFDRPPRHRHPKYMYSLLKIIRQHRIQLIHTHTYGSKFWAILCKLIVPRLKVVFTIHDMDVIKSFNSMHLGLHRVMIDCNVAISDAVLKESIRRKLFKTTRIYNGIHTRKFLDYRKRDLSITDEIKIVSVGRITHQIKGQDILIQAVKECIARELKVTCSFIGGIYEYDKHSFHYLNQLIDRLEINKEIHFLGNRTDVNQLLADYDVFVLPSRNEGLGLVILEAMAAGLPVIVSDIDGPAELVEHGVNGYLFESENVTDLANKIIDFSKNKGQVEQMARHALQHVEKFDISVMLDLYTSMYHEVLTKPQNKQGSYAKHKNN